MSFSKKNVKNRKRCEKLLGRERSVGILYLEESKNFIIILRRDDLITNF